MIEAPAPVAPAQYAALSVVPDGDGYVLGSTYTRDFVAVPRIGGEVVRWLQSGLSVDECAARAEREMGGPVDVAGFLAGLTAAGLLPESPETAAPAPPAAEVPRWRWRDSRRWSPYRPWRPRYTDLIVSQVPLLSMLLGVVLAAASGLTHEFAHVLGAAARGVPSRISISRRMVTLVYQTDLTRRWSVPRRARVVPLLAGILVDAAIAGAGVLLELGGFAGPLVRAVVFVNLSAILFQLQVCMRTDLYALFVVVTGCRNLWATKGAVARRLIGRATPENRALLGTVGRREIAWARVYLVLYVLGVLWTAWYFTVFGVPAIARLAACRLRRWPRTGCSHRSARREPPGWPSPSRPPGSSCAALLARRSGSSGRFWAAPAPRPAGTDERRPRPAGTGARSPRRSMLPGPAEVKEAVAWAVAGSPAGPRRGRFSATAAARLGRARPPGARGPCPRFGRALGTPGSAGCAWPTR
ncbi:MAG: hypothetical protein E6F99_24025 [Actinobacteria bacterium]|nr:MAG: hypothetical protein E6F99_24025 [Actinomycetota bacterium]